MPFIYFNYDSLYSGRYVTRSNSEIADATVLAVFARVISVNQLKSVRHEYLGQKVTIRIDAIFKGEYKAETLTFITESSGKQINYRQMKKGENGIFLFKENYFPVDKKSK